MSLLQNLQARKNKLKHTDTLVTCADGTRYIERHSNTNLDKTISIISQTGYGFVIDTAPDDTPALVVPNLYIGSQDCCAPEVINTYSIDYVLSIGITSPHFLSHVTYKFVECLDLPSTELTHVFAQCNPVIRHALGQARNILVHCNAGVSRSAAVIIGFLIQDRKMSYDDAHQLVKSVRTCIQPNPGFVKQLKTII